MDKTRRAVLKGMGGLVASMSLPLQLFPRPGNAALIPSPRRLVVIQLAGGNDGVNTVIPMDSQYDNYFAMRTKVSDIALPLSAINYFGNSVNGTELGLHPALAGLMGTSLLGTPLKDKLAVFPATHTGLRSDTSHFFQFDYIDNGNFVGAQNTPDSLGWAGRFLQSQLSGQSPDGIVAFDFGSKRKLFRGSVPSINLLNPANLDLGTGSQAAADAIWNDVEAASEELVSGYEGIYAASQRQLFNDALLRLDPQNVDFTRPPNVPYPGGLGTQLRRVTDMLIGLPELAMVHLEMGGFDTHNDQVDSGDTTTGRHQRLLAQLGDSLVAFYNDLEAEDQKTGGDLLNNVTVVVMSEFGRTVDSNGTGGTDHGQAATWFVFGGPVIGGIYGDYPGLAPDQLVSNNGGADPAKERFWLRQTVDYRDILSELLGPNFLGGTVEQANAAFYAGYPGALNPLQFLLPPTA